MKYYITYHFHHWGPINHYNSYVRLYPNQRSSLRTTGSTNKTLFKDLSLTRTIMRVFKKEYCYNKDCDVNIHNA